MARSIAERQGGSHALTQAARIGHGRELDEPYAIRKIFSDADRDLERKTRLPTPAYASQRDKPLVARPQQGNDLRQVALAPDQGVAWHRQGRGEHFDAPSSVHCPTFSARAAHPDG